MLEAAVVIDTNNQPVYWHTPPERSGGSLPDSQKLWEVIWEHRDVLKGLAHSHPGSGVPGPSWEDRTTFSAIERALGQRLDWWITSSDTVVLLRWAGPDKHNYEAVRIEDPPWVGELRRLSV